MKLVLYSGGQERSNHKLHQAVVELTGRRRGLQLAYIPFCSEGSSVFYQRAIRRYRAHGVQKFLCLKVDQRPDESEIRNALQSDIIYLAGGNTFYFLNHLRKSGMLPKLANYVKEGGVLTGLSAGALILTPTIKLAGAKNLDPDDNDVGLKDLQGMGLVDFEFAPHFSTSSKMITALTNYSKKSPYPVYACSDGGGILIQDEKFSILGKASVFYQGVRCRLS